MRCRARFVAIVFISFLAQAYSSHYSTLGISPSADEREIKRAYRAAAMLHHPDKPTGDTDKFQEVSTAYEILINPVSRRRYDEENSRRQSHSQRHYRNSGSSMPQSNGKTYLFRQGGQTFIFTEDELFGRHHQQFHSHNEPQVSILEGLWSLVGHLLVFGIIFYALRGALPSDQRSQSDNPKNKNDYGADKNTTSKCRQTKREREPTPIEVLATIHAPHVCKFESSLLRQRARRCCVFFPRHCDKNPTWSTLEKISLTFIHDRLDFSWVDLPSDPEWQAFLACEYPGQAWPLAIVFGSTGSKASRFPSSSFASIDSAAPLTPLSPVKDLIGRWVERILEGIEELSKVVNEPPKHRA